jgi:uncharacterized protein YjbI with pentapeptide repeats
MNTDNSVAELLKGVQNWNKWRKDNPLIKPNLSNQDFTKKAFIGANFEDVNFQGTNLSECKLMKSNFIKADLSRAILDRAHLLEADFTGANLNESSLMEAQLKKVAFYNACLVNSNLSYANLEGAVLEGAILTNVNLEGSFLYQSNFQNATLSNSSLKNAYIVESNLSKANLEYSILIEACFNQSNLTDANLTHANLTGCGLEGTLMIRTNLSNTIFNGCKVYGISVWDVKGEIGEQKDLVVTSKSIERLTVDNIKVAQFIYLLLENNEIRDFISTITSKVVLVLGRFSPERKKTLDTLKDSLRSKGYLPILFDFEKPFTRDLVETVKILISLSKFVIADISDARSVLQELQILIPSFPSIPVMFIRSKEEKEYGMLDHLRKFPWVLDIYVYNSEEHLLSYLEEKVINPLEQRIQQLG